MKNNINIGVILIALIFGFGIGYTLDKNGIEKLDTENHGVAGHDMESTMEEMSHNLHDLKGDEFDQGFLKDMIEHHEGAVHMAEHALENSNRAEIKELANKILVEQSKEIAQMKLWQVQWKSQY